MGRTDPTAIDFTAWTLIVAFVVTVPNFAVTIAAPAATPVTSPVASTVANEPLEGVTLHATARLMGCFDPSLNVPIAIIGRVEPIATPAVPGVSAMDVSEAAVTPSGAAPVVPPKEACIWVVPKATAVATPFGVVLETVAAAGVVLVQFASTVMSCCVLSLNTPRAAKG